MTTQSSEAESTNALVERLSGYFKEVLLRERDVFKAIPMGVRKERRRGPRHNRSVRCPPW